MGRRNIRTTALLITLLILAFATDLFSQDRLTGIVRSTNGEALFGASVFIVNTSSGTSTDSAGQFLLTNIPKGNFRIAVSYIGYEVYTLSISGSSIKSSYQIILSPRAKELDSIVVAFKTEKWKNWGTTFMEAFIGNSDFAANCRIVNQDIISFNYNSATNELKASASKPILIENESLGYNINVDLVDFSYNTSSKIVDYQVYSYFTEMEGTERRQRQWKTNRLRAYKYSLMHFMRSLYAAKLSSAGFECRLYEVKSNPEKTRVQQVFNTQYIRIKDSLEKEGQSFVFASALVDKQFQRDSLRYYKRILSQYEKPGKLNLSTTSAEHFTKRTDNGMVLLQFQQYLVVKNTKLSEPEAYRNYRKMVNEQGSLSSVRTQTYTTLENPVTVLNLSQNIAIEINENGYFQNTNLILDGFWGWWEKMATRLPYDYTPD